MTTIAYKNGVLAADTQVCEAGYRVGRSVKIGERNGVLFGCAGSLGKACQFNSWVASGMKGEPPNMGSGDNSGQGIIVHGRNIVSLWRYYTIRTQKACKPLRDMPY